ncbi:TPA: hypothetical protein RJR48_002506 [Mannheimia haemolytica]|nr:hypothetical protein [Mannheimia haemolytica]HDV6364064.1 hypothetical protein [Mannheimia haemolytica]
MITYKCPKCNGELEDLSINDEWGWFLDEPYRCNGHYTGRFPNISRDSTLNRTKSCGYFSKEEVKKVNDTQR